MASSCGGWAPAVEIAAAPSGHVARRSTFRKIRVNARAIGQLTLPEAPAVHSVGRMHELELASHMRAARVREIRDHAPGVVRDEIRRRVYAAPVTPAPAAPAAPAGPERPDAINCRFLGDLKVLSAVRLTARQRCIDGPGNPIGTLPVKGGRAGTGRRGSSPGSHRSATSRHGDKQRQHQCSILIPHCRFSRSCPSAKLRRFRQEVLPLRVAFRFHGWHEILQLKLACLAILPSANSMPSRRRRPALRIQ
jgi:hypothetical protein